MCFLSIFMPLTSHCGLTLFFVYFQVNTGVLSLLCYYVEEICLVAHFVTWSPRACHYYDTLRRAHHSFLTRCIGWRKHNRADHPISYLDTLVKTGSESIEATLRRRRILFAGFVARMEDTRLPKLLLFKEKSECT